MKHDYRRTPTPRLVEMLDALLEERSAWREKYFSNTINLYEYRNATNAIAPTIEALRHEIARRNIKEREQQ
jgi:hypothetical protein